MANSAFKQKGISGYSGYSGAGTSGYSGTSGFSGLDGSASASGESGTSGYSGTSGLGISGATGASGTSGYSGTSGSGTSGYSGTSGFSGVSGKGTSGYSGYVGNDGDPGQDGASGWSGFSGADGEQGTSGYSGQTGGGLLDSSNTDVTLSDTSETTLYSFTLTGGTLSTGNGIRIRVPLSVFGIVSNTSQTFRLRYGSATMADATLVAEVLLDTADTLQASGGTIEAELFGAGTTSSQFGFLTVIASTISSSLSSIGGSDDGTASEDSTGDLTVYITGQKESGGAGSNVTVVGGYAHKL